MDKCEKWTQEYLAFRGFRNIAYEPDGNVPPDFLVDSRIAIEVRRLNQHHEKASGTLEPLEQLAIPLERKLVEFLDSFGPPSEDRASWYVFYDYRRPQLTKHWEPILRNRLETFLSEAVQETETVIQIDKHFSLHLIKRREPGQQIFIMGGHYDGNAGGWVIPALEKNLKLCIEEKTRKIAPYRAKYPEWWLVLVDFIAAGEQEEVHITHDWDRVIVIHPSNYAGAYEVVGTRSCVDPARSSLRRGT
jgi:hypothetical protein